MREGGIFFFFFFASAHSVTVFYAQCDTYIIHVYVLGPTFVQIGLHV